MPTLIWMPISRTTVRTTASLQAQQFDQANGHAPIPILHFRSNAIIWAEGLQAQNDHAKLEEDESSTGRANELANAN
jgi:Mlc titration factor MtfA (ptsG expression regulator)